MFKTIMLGTTISIQGRLVEVLEDGRVLIRVGTQIFAGVPV